MKLLIEEKQLGRLSYFVSSIDVLEEILKTAKIAHSRTKELLISYDDDTYYLRLVNWKKFEISETMFDKIQSEISNMTDGEKIKSGLTYQSGGKRLINGHRIREKYVFSARYGGLTLTDQKFPEICSMISKLPSVNEYEERVWIKNGFYISIKGCILGIIVPGDMTEDESDFYDMYIQPVIDLLNVETTIFY